MAIWEEKKKEKKTLRDWAYIPKATVHGLKRLFKQLHETAMVVKSCWSLKHPQCFHKIKVTKVAKSEIHTHTQNHEQNCVTVCPPEPQNTE